MTEQEREARIRENYRNYHHQPVRVDCPNHGPVAGVVTGAGVEHVVGRCSRCGHEQLRRITRDAQQ